MEICQAGQLAPRTTLSGYLSVTQLPTSPAIFSLRTKGATAKWSQAIRLFSWADIPSTHQGAAQRTADGPSLAKKRCSLGICAAGTCPPPRKEPVPTQIYSVLGSSYFPETLPFPCRNWGGKGLAILHLMMS